MIQRLTQPFLRALTRDRTSVYPWFVVVGLALAWVVSSALGPGWMDLTGKPIGTDFLTFYAASSLISDPTVANLYDLDIAVVR
jgi:alpha-1,2-mannosyltransferase